MAVATALAQVVDLPFTGSSNTHLNGAAYSDVLSVECAKPPSNPQIDSDYVDGYNGELVCVVGQGMGLCHLT